MGLNFRDYKITSTMTIFLRERGFWDFLRVHHFKGYILR